MCVRAQVNNVDFANIIREEAVLFLLDLPRGEEVTILAQKKKDGEREAGVSYTHPLAGPRVTFVAGCFLFWKKEKWF